MKENLYYYFFFTQRNMQCITPKVTAQQSQHPWPQAFQLRLFFKLTPAIHPTCLVRYGRSRAIISSHTFKTASISAPSSIWPHQLLWNYAITEDTTACNRRHKREGNRPQAFTPGLNKRLPQATVNNCSCDRTITCCSLICPTTL